MNCSYIVLKEPVWPVDLLGGGSGLFPFGAPPSDPKCTRPYVAMPAPRPSSQADLRSDAFERPPPLSAPDAGLLGGLRRGVPSERESSTGSWSSSGCVGSNMRRSTFRIHVSAFRLSLTCRMSRSVAPRRCLTSTRSPLEWVCNDALVSGLD